MICKECKLDISADCIYSNHICVFCAHNITNWDSNGELITKYDAIRPFTCPNCLRKVPNKSWFKKKGCKWCQK